MNVKQNIKVKYIKPREDITEAENHTRLVKFITLFAQVGFRDIALNGEANIKLNFVK